MIKAERAKGGANVLMSGSCEDLAYELEAILVGLVRNKEI